MTIMVTDLEREQRLLSLTRPGDSLSRLPVPYRWEFTRRHPIYLQYWEAARNHRSHPSDDPEAIQKGELAALMLCLIGVVGEPLPPDSPADQLGEKDLGKVWEGGAIAPLSFRGLINLLLAAVSPDDRRVIAELLVHSADESDRNVHPFSLLHDFQKIQVPLLDKLVPAPILSINVHASQRSIVESIERFVRNWKEDKGIAETRRRDDRLDDYLRVWDLREGWTGTSYDAKQEFSFRQIAEREKKSLPTIRSIYQRAFEILTGHAFTGELWFELFAIDRVNSLCDSSSGMLPPRYRKLRGYSSVKSPVPESQLIVATEDHRPGLIGSKIDSNQSPDYLLLLADIRELIVQGKGNDEIMKKLDLTNEMMPRFIDWCRDHIEDKIFDLEA